MSFWSSEKLRQRQRRDELIMPFDSRRIKHGAYELSLGPEVFVSTEPKGIKQNLQIGQQLPIPPGQFGLLLTEEIITVPPDAIGFISIRFGIKMRGLVNVSGFHVDPGFSGQLKFAVYNAGSQDIILARGERVFIIWFSALSEATRDVYNGEHDGQNEITSTDVMHLQGEVASPAALKKQLDEMRSEYERRLTVLDEKITTSKDEMKREHEQRLSVLDDKITTWRTVTITLLASLFVAVVVGMIFLVLRIYVERPVVPSSPPPPSVSSPRPSQDLKQPEPAPSQQAERPTNTPSSTPATNRN